MIVNVSLDVFKAMLDLPPSAARMIGPMLPYLVGARCVRVWHRESAAR